MTMCAVMPVMLISRVNVSIADISGRKIKGDAEATAIRRISVVIGRIGVRWRVSGVASAVWITAISGGSEPGLGRYGCCNA
jgi:hypothetical protein